MANRATAELHHDILAQQVQQLVDLAGVDAARGHREHARHRTPVLLKVETLNRVDCDLAFAQGGVEALDAVRVAL